LGQTVYETENDEEENREGSRYCPPKSSDFEKISIIKLMIVTSVALRILPRYGVIVSVITALSAVSKMSG